MSCYHRFKVCTCVKISVSINRVPSIDQCTWRIGVIRPSYCSYLCCGICLRCCSRLVRTNLSGFGTKTAPIGRGPSLSMITFFVWNGRRTRSRQRRSIHFQHLNHDQRSYSRHTQFLEK